MKKIDVSGLKRGDRFSKPVYLDPDTVFISSNSPITESDLERLAKFGIKIVYSDGNKIEEQPIETTAKYTDDKLPFLDHSEDGMRLKVIYDKIIQNRYEFESIYSNALDIIQKSYKIVSEGKSVEIREFREIAEKMCDFTKNNSQLLIYLNSSNSSSYYLYHQAVNATFFSLIIGLNLDYSRPKLIDLALGALMADIGMVLIPSNTSEKTSALDENERKIILKHTLVGYQILTQRIKLKNSLAVISLQHHENFDGSGYPQRLNGNGIEEFARIYSIADNFAALISKRPQRPALLPHDAIKKMIGEMVTKFDLKMVGLFLSIQSMYPLGSYVELSDGRIGMVLDVNKDKPIRPSVRILKESDGQKVKTLQFSNLANDLQLYIIKPLDPKIAN
jgi:HD-GYP domain-containing protein (c-di-GMP phosphodiesterase class II)